MKHILLSATALTALTASAFAADLPTRKEPVFKAPLPVFTWTGFYAGVSSGYVNLRTRVDGTNIGSSLSLNNTAAGGIFGATLGYNQQYGQLVVGVEGDLSFAAASHSTNNYLIFSGEATSKLNSLGTVRARVGYAFDRTLLYVTGGVAIASVSGESGISGYSDCRASFSTTKTGWVIGGGVEQAITDHVTLKAEVLYTDLGKKSVVTPGGCTASFKNTATIARIGANYKF